MNPVLKYSLFGAGGLLLIGIIKSGSWKWTDESDIFQPDATLKPEIITGGEPILIQGQDSSRTDSEIQEQIRKSCTYYSSCIDAIVSSIGLPASVTEDWFVQLIQTYSGTNGLYEKAFDAYMRCIELWSATYALQSEAVTKSIASIVADANDVDVTTCTKTVYVADVSEEAGSQTTITLQKKNGFLGMNKTETSVKETLEYYNRKVTYVPHCDVWQVDPTKVEVVQANMTLGIRSAYGVLKNVIDSCPSITKFLIS